MMNTKCKRYSPRKKALYAIALGAINFFGFIILTTTVSQYFIIPTIGVPLICGIFLLSIRCEACGHLIYKRKTRIFGEDITYWGGVIPKKCPACGKDLISGG